MLLSRTIIIFVLLNTVRIRLIPFLRNNSLLEYTKHLCRTPSVHLMAKPLARGATNDASDSRGGHDQLNFPAHLSRHGKVQYMAAPSGSGAPEPLYCNPDRPCLS